MCGQYHNSVKQKKLSTKSDKKKKKVLQIRPNRTTCIHWVWWTRIWLQSGNVVKKKKKKRWKSKCKWVNCTSVAVLVMWSFTFGWILLIWDNDVFRWLMLRVSRCCQNRHDITFTAILWTCPVCLACCGSVVLFCFSRGDDTSVPAGVPRPFEGKPGVDYCSHASVSAVSCSVRSVHTECGSQQQQQQQPVQSEPVWPDRLLPLHLPPAEETLCWSRSCATATSKALCIIGSIRFNWPGLKNGETLNSLATVEANTLGRILKCMVLVGRANPTILRRMKRRWSCSACGCHVFSFDLRERSWQKRWHFH